MLRYTWIQFVSSPFKDERDEISWWWLWSTGRNEEQNEERLQIQSFCTGRYITWPKRQSLRDAWINFLSFYRDQWDPTNRIMTPPRRPSSFSSQFPWLLCWAMAACLYSLLPYYIYMFILNNTNRRDLTNIVMASTRHVSSLCVPVSMAIVIIGSWVLLVLSQASVLICCLTVFTCTVSLFD